jgi:hypothetical protein
MSSIKHFVWLFTGAITLWLAIGCSIPHRPFDNTSTSSQEIPQEPIEKIII